MSEYKEFDFEGFFCDLIEIGTPIIDNLEELNTDYLDLIYAHGGTKIKNLNEDIMP